MEKGEMEKKRRKIVKRKEENRRRKKFENEERTLFFFFFFFAFHFSKQLKNCFGANKIEIFYQEKEFHAGKKFRKNDFAPSEPPQKNFPVTPLLETTSSLKLLTMTSFRIQMGICSKIRLTKRKIV